MRMPRALHHALLYLCLAHAQTRQPQGTPTALVSEFSQSEKGGAWGLQTGNLMKKCDDYSSSSNGLPLRDWRMVYTMVGFRVTMVAMQGV